jgi:hypothetical protein
MMSGYLDDPRFGRWFRNHLRSCYVMVAEPFRDGDGWHVHLCVRGRMRERLLVRLKETWTRYLLVQHGIARPQNVRHRQWRVNVQAPRRGDTPARSAATSASTSAVCLRPQGNSKPDPGASTRFDELRCIPNSSRYDAISGLAWWLLLSPSFCVFQPVSRAQGTRMAREHKSSRRGTRAIHHRSPTSRRRPHGRGSSPRLASRTKPCGSGSLIRPVRGAGCGSRERSCMPPTRRSRSG